MSVGASQWAWNRCVGSPGAKLVLMVLADYANERAECFPFVGTIATRTEQSIATVHRRLRELESAGLIERLEQYREDGSRTSNLFRLLMDDRAGSAGDPERGGISQIERGYDADCDRPHITGDIPPNAAVTGPKEPPSEPPLEPTPHSPPVGGGVGGSGHGDGSQFGAFMAAYAQEPSALVNRPPAARAWAKLELPEDRANALLHLPRYLDHCRKHKRKVKAPATYLTERAWEQFAVAPAAVAPAAQRELSAQARAVRWACSDADKTKWAFVAEGSAEWRAWHAAFTAEGLAFAGGSFPLLYQTDGTVKRSTERGRVFPMLHPPPRGAPDQQQDAAE